MLRILAMYEAKTAKNSNFWMFWSITLLIRGQNVQKLQILLFFASYIASILKGTENLKILWTCQRMTFLHLIDPSTMQDWTSGHGWRCIQRAFWNSLRVSRDEFFSKLLIFTHFTPKWNFGKLFLRGTQRTIFFRTQNPFDMAPYGDTSSVTSKMECAGPIGAPLFQVDG